MKFRSYAVLSAFFFIGRVAHSVDVTVYNQNLGLIRETRTIHLKSGVNDIAIFDVPSQIDATSVHFKSLTAPDALSVLEQNFQYDLISREKLLERYIGKEIEVERIYGLNGEKKETIKGTLLSNQGGQVIQVGKKLQLNPTGSLILPELPEGLLTKPTLLWKLDSDKPGKHECEISYLTGGMGWSADYVLVTNAKDDRMDLNTWVTINNNSGATLKDAKLKLVAGDVNRAPQPQVLASAMYAEADSFAGKRAAPGFTEKSFFEYHLYTLGRPTTLADNETKQIEMAAATDVPLKKLYIYDPAQNFYSNDFNEYTRSDANYGATNEKKVWVMLEFKNSKDNKLGIPLPKGRVRVYKKDTDDALEFIGEDSIDHTPKEELVRIKMGNAFDIVGERTRKDFSSDVNRRWFQETFEIKIRNHKEEAVTVKVVEHLYRWNNWKILDSSMKFQKKDAQTVEFSVPVPKDGETVVTYTVKYSW